MDKETKEQINQMWENGHTLGELNNLFCIAKQLPKELKDVTKTTRLMYTSDTDFTAFGVIAEFQIEKLVFQMETLNGAKNSRHLRRRCRYSELSKNFAVYDEVKHAGIEANLKRMQEIDMELGESIANFYKNPEKAIEEALQKLNEHQIEELQGVSDIIAEKRKEIARLEQDISCATDLIQGYLTKLYQQDVVGFLDMKALHDQFVVRSL